MRKERRACPAAQLRNASVLRARRCETLLAALKMHKTWRQICLHVQPRSIPHIIEADPTGSASRVWLTGGPDRQHRFPLVSFSSFKFRIFALGLAVHSDPRRLSIFPARPYGSLTETISRPTAPDAQIRTGHTGDDESKRPRSIRHPALTTPCMQTT